MKEIKTILVVISFILTMFVFVPSVSADPTSGSANWQESSATVGQTIHADFTWANAKYKPNPYDCYSDMYIKDPYGNVAAEFIGDQSSGSKTLSCTTVVTGTWLAEIKVWDGSQWLIYPDTLYVAPAGQTSGGADWEESSANAGDTVHADFTWANAKYKPNPYDCYSDMYIKDPTGAVKAESLGEQSSGSHTLSFTANMEGTWLAEIKVWDGSQWLVYPDYLTVSSPSSPYLSFDPSTINLGTHDQGWTGSFCFDIWNGGTGTLTFSISDSIPWITSIDPSIGSSIGEHNTIIVNVGNTDSMSGYYSGDIVISSNGGSSSVYVDIIIETTDNPPTACFTWEDYDGNGPGTTIHFDAYCSFDDDGIVSYMWDIDNDGSIDCGGISPTITYYDTSDHEIRLIVKNTRDQTDEVVQTVHATVDSQNNIPKPEMFGEDGRSKSSAGRINEVLSFYAGIDDPYYGRITISLWFDWGDGTDGSWTDPQESGGYYFFTHTWGTSGTYYVKVKAKDVNGAESQWSEPFEVTIVEKKEAEDHLALIICGYESDPRAFMFGYSSSQAYNTFKSLGYNDDQIYFLAHSTDDDRVDCDIIDTNIKWAFLDIYCRSDENTQIFIYVCGHGNSDVIDLGFGSLTAIDFNNYLSSTIYKNCAILINCCYAGAFGLKLSANNRLIYATSDGENSNENGFTYAFFDYLRWGYSYGVAWMAGDGAAASSIPLILYNPQIDDNGDGISHGHAGLMEFGVDKLPFDDGEGELSLNVWPSDTHNKNKDGSVSKTYFKSYNLLLRILNRFPLLSSLFEKIVIKTNQK